MTDASDIVERLRVQANLRGLAGVTEFDAAEAIVALRGEVERLTREREEERASMAVWLGQRDALVAAARHAERKGFITSRLHEALAEYDEGVGDDPP